MNSKEANAVPLTDILEKYGHEPAKRYGGYLMYSSPFRRDSDPSFKVDLNTNKWKDFGDCTSGGAVDLVMRMENCSFSQAMQRMEKSEFSSNVAVMPAVPSVEPEGINRKLVVLNTIPLQNRALLNYVQNRGIDADIAKAYCNEVYYCFEKNSRPCFALGFKNDREGIELRNSLFKGCALSKDITCFDNGSSQCAVFEGFFDMLSYLQYAREHPGLPTLNLCVLNSTAMTDRTKDFLSRHTVVHAFLDNDTSGQRALQRISHLVPRDTVIVNESARLYPKHNDFNEFLQACKKKVLVVQNEM